MIIVVGEGQFKNVMKEMVEGVNGELSKIKNLTDLTQKVATLKKEKENLEDDIRIQKANIAEREREITHKVGLERKRQEFEIEQARRETKLQIQQANLDADKKRFAEQMEFHEKRFTEEVKYLKEMITDMMQRLPSMEVISKLNRTI